MAEASEQTAFLDPAALMEAGRRVADTTPEETPTEAPAEPPDSEQFVAAKTARWALVWPGETTTPTEREALLLESRRCRALLSEGEQERLDAALSAEIDRQLDVLRRYVEAEETKQATTTEQEPVPPSSAQPAQPEHPTTSQEET